MVLSCLKFGCDGKTACLEASRFEHPKHCLNVHVVVKQAGTRLFNHEG